MIQETQASFLGKGWGFPPSFDEKTLSVEMVSDEADIHQSLFILFSTSPGERIMNPHYGCDLNKMVFEKISDSLRSSIISTVSNAILHFEPRITVENVEVIVVSHEDGLLHIMVDYTIIQTNSRRNIVYPYYLLEGTNIIT